MLIFFNYYPKIASHEPTSSISLSIFYGTLVMVKGEYYKTKRVLWDVAGIHSKAGGLNQNYVNKNHAGYISHQGVMDFDREYTKDILYMNPRLTPLFKHKNILQNLEFHAKAADCMDRLQSSLFTMQLMQVAHRKLAELSYSYRIRTALALLLINNANLWIIDFNWNFLQTNLREEIPDITNIIRNIIQVKLDNGGIIVCRGHEFLLESGIIQPNNSLEIAI